MSDTHRKQVPLRFWTSNSNGCIFFFENLGVYSRDMYGRDSDAEIKSKTGFFLFHQILLYPR